MPILQGKDYILHIQMSDVQCHIEKILKITNKDGKIVNPMFINKNMFADVIVKTDNKIPLELYKDLHIYGRFVLRSNGYTIAAGKIIEIL